MTDSQEQLNNTKRRRSWPRRIIRWVIILVMVALIADFILLPLGIAVYAATPLNSDVGDPPAGFTTVELKASDGTRLAAWYLPPQNGIAIILLPGAGGTRKGLVSRAEMLAENGYGVLALDPRGVGESDGQTNRFGWEGSADVSGAVEYLMAQSDVQVIGGWGISMGGEILLGAIGEHPQLAAVVTDGATARCYEEKFDLDSAASSLEKFHTWITFSFVGLLTGDEPPTTILKSIRANDTTRLLLIAAGNVEEEIDYNNMFADAAGDRAEVWVVPDVGHTSGWGHHREEYTRRILEFFGEMLPED
ncbi:MAG: alpha/beta fold hydrolase [Chloroflexi bacterium]|nr:alpha/beta fold hydrolase [Chloroflexota bacterium]